MGESWSYAAFCQKKQRKLEQVRFSQMDDAFLLGDTWLSVPNCFQVIWKYSIYVTENEKKKSGQNKPKFKLCVT